MICIIIIILRSIETPLTKNQCLVEEHLQAQRLDARSHPHRLLEHLHNHPPGHCRWSNHSYNEWIKQDPRETAEKRKINLIRGLKSTMIGVGVNRTYRIFNFI